MLPVVLDCADWPIILVGAGPLAVRRLALLDAAESCAVSVFAPTEDPALQKAAGSRSVPRAPTEAEIAAARLMLVAGLGPADGEPLAALARRHRVLVNVEDEPLNCDFHMPAIVRRGALLLTVSTGGRSPVLAGRLRRWLAERFGPEWAGRLDAAADVRTQLRTAGRGDEVSSAVNVLIDRERWLP
ncbi:Precorrin-2 dehydrogenase [Rhodovastum atsumiense]|uniref:precorrin-2 dehydrogenase n=1 Tax=Rhodovastum atsumiense TaxID=504468 RepID=A0A5M6IWB5_9PROT|nr:NAD(P)-dependent oxidoreductase [Rhodovastum atsumiense]KAA5611695.1 siroheme synthase [Rhodovastum atsumiense]CAH2604269.1 Precorrin-2 dehydrogenase [Rhodovastum atsumiense]